MRRSIRFAARLVRWSVYVVLAGLILVVLVLVVLQTGWAKNQLRRLIVSQANQYLTATLSIGRLQGSLVRGIQLSDITLSREGQTLISIDDVALSYSIRELVSQGTSIRRIRLARLHVVAQKQPDGRWNLGALIKRTAREGQVRGPGRPIHFDSIEISDGIVSVLDPVMLGPAHVPLEYHDLDVSFAFDYQPVAWHAAFENASFTAAAPDLRVSRLTGGIGNGSAGWVFDHLVVETPKSLFTLDGRVDRRSPPVRLPLTVDAERFAFQEWAGILTGLKNIAIDAQFTAKLDGPTNALATDLALRSNGGDVRGKFVLDSSVSGWAAKGAVDVDRLNLAAWLNRPDRPSNITGHVTFGLTDVGLRPGGHFPIGTYAFEGPHAGYLEYEADAVKAHGTITATEARIATATARAYGANVSISSGFIGIDAPFRFAFIGTTDSVDLRKLPKQVPVPHVDSLLAFDYDVTGQFTSPFLTGRAAFAESTFLGARVGAGTIGAVDTAVTPFHYSGEGDLSRIDLHRFGTGLDVQWLQEPRYAGTVAGHFHVDGAGSDTATMTLTGGGRLTRADLFGGRLTDADVSIQIGDGSLTGSYNGLITEINPALALGDQRYDAALTGSGHAEIVVKDLLVRSPELADYTIEAQMALGPSRVWTVDVDSATLAATLTDGGLQIREFHGRGPAIELEATGRLELDGNRSSQIDYSVLRGDLALVKDWIGRDIAGEMITKGQLTGPSSQIRLVGEGTVARVESSGMTALSANLKYDATVPTEAPAKTSVEIDGRVTSIEAFGQQINEAAGNATYNHGEIVADVQLRQQDLTARVAGMFVLHPEEKQLDLQQLSLTIQQSAWRLVPTDGRTRLAWSDRGIVADALAFVDEATGSQRITVDGTWHTAGDGALHVTAKRVSLDALTANPEEPARYGGMLDLDAILRGTREQPLVSGQIAITDGRVWRVPYERLAGRVDYTDGAFQIDLRLDQREGVWMTAAGRAPLGLFYADRPDLPLSVKVTSSSVDLGLLEGLTNVVAEVSGAITLDVNVIGTTRDPHFDGRVDITNAGFLVTDSGARYRNARLAARLATERVTVDALHVEDANGHALDVQGSLGTHELRVGDLAIDVTARDFEVLRNEYGRMDINARLELRGEFESPRLEGRITVSGGTLNVDRILDRTMLRPYSVAAAPAPQPVDAIASLNPWQRLGLGLELNVPNTLRMVGESIQLSSNTPLGFGGINLRALGDLYLYKDPGQPLYVTGSLDQVTGRILFQGRRFDLDPISSITFRGDLNPELYVTVMRDISGVQARVTIAGALGQPELRLASTPPLAESDILSLIVFNTSTNQLSTLQQQQLAVRAGTLAAGFVAAPIMAALERSLGVDTLEIEPIADARGGTGARVTVGNEIAPGLVASFSRNFGEFGYNEATIEYYLSRIFRIRATFSDAGDTVARPQFRTVERAGVDLLLFFSF
jgi:autotransporter translocation and assembly factor TamB